MSNIYIQRMMGRYGGEEPPDFLSKSAVVEVKPSKVGPEFYVMHQQVPNPNPWNAPLRPESPNSNLGKKMKENEFELFRWHDQEVSALLKRFVDSDELKSYLSNSKYTGPNSGGRTSAAFIEYFDQEVDKVNKEIGKLLRENLKMGLREFNELLERASRYKESRILDHLEHVGRKTKSYMRYLATRADKLDRVADHQEVASTLLHFFENYSPFHELFSDFFGFFSRLEKDILLSQEVMSAAKEEYSKENWPKFEFKPLRLAGASVARQKGREKERRNLLPIERLLKEHKGSQLTSGGAERSFSSNHFGSEVSPEIRRELSWNALADFGRKKRRLLELTKDNCSRKELEKVINGAKVEKEVSTLHGPYEKITAIEKMDEYERIFTGADDGTICLTNCTCGSNLAVLTGHKGAVRSLCYISRTGRLVSGSEDHKIKVWDVANRQCIRTVLGHDGAVWGVQSIPEKSQVVSVSEDKTLRFWSALDFRCDGILVSPENQPFRALAVHNHLNNAFVYAGGWTIYEIDCQTQKIKREFQGHQYYVRTIVLLSETNLLLSSGEDKMVAAWNWSNGNLVSRFFMGGGILSMAVLGSKILVTKTINETAFWHIQSASFDALAHAKEKSTSEAICSLENGNTLVVPQFNRLRFEEF